MWPLMTFEAVLSYIEVGGLCWFLVWCLIGIGRIIREKEVDRTKNKRCESLLKRKRDAKKKRLGECRRVKVKTERRETYPDETSSVAQSFHVSVSRNASWNCKRESVTCRYSMVLIPLVTGKRRSWSVIVLDFAEDLLLKKLDHLDRGRLG